MLKKITLAAAAAFTALAAVPAVADAQPRGRAHGYWNNSAHARGHHVNKHQRADRYGAYQRDGSYGRDGYYGQNQGRYQDSTEYRRCRGTTGTIVGGAAGALAGRAILGRGTLGTVAGAAAGALAGRAIDRNRCRN